jgi:O-antigen/teichoic acid export membrane protein
MTVVLLLPNVLYGVGAALLNERRGAADARGFDELFGDGLRMTLIAVLGGILVVGLGGPALLNLIGHGFRSSYPVVLALLAATLPESITIALNQLLQAHARMWQAFLFVSLPRDLLMPTLAFILAPLYGPLGGALAYLAGRLLAAACIAVLVRRPGTGPATVLARGPQHG